MTDAPPGNEKPRFRRDRVRLQETTTGLLVYDIESDSLFHANRTASMVLELLDGTRSWAQIAHALADRHGWATAEIAADLSTFARELMTVGLLEEPPWNSCIHP